MPKEASADLTHYLPFLDGLRAVAILAVVLYHIGLPPFAGGFVGVDVFFVISGFLIVGQITEAQRKNRFSVVGFYARRALRILPLLLFVLLATCLAARYVLVFPEEYRDFGRSEVAAAEFLSNFYFLRHQGYFDAALDIQPLLHTWSLSLEAQFYAFMPIIAWGLVRIFGPGTARGPALAIGCLIALVSLGTCIAFTTLSDNAAFYLIPFRAWEFAAGAGVLPLMAPARRLPVRWLETLGIAGLLAILFGVFDYGPDLPYPSWRPLPAVLGSALIILAGMAHPKAFIARLLALRPIVAIGLVSYGWYLWHWALLVFDRIYRLNTPDLIRDFLIGGVLGLALAILTYRAIERPIARNKSLLLGRRPLVALAASLVCCLLTMLPSKVFTGDLAHSAAARLTSSDLPRKTDLHALSDPCILFPGKPLDAGCLAGSLEHPVGLLFGDSEARESYRSLANAADQADVRFITIVQSGCGPFFDRDAGRLSDGRHCLPGWNAVRASLIDRQPNLAFAILQARWVSYGAAPPRDRLIDALFFRVLDPVAVARAALARDLARTIGHLRALGVGRILIVGPAPEFATDAPVCLARARIRSLPADACGAPRAILAAAVSPIRDIFMDLARRFPDIRLIDPFMALCDGAACREDQNGLPLYFDNRHLSRLGADRLFHFFAKDLAWVFGRPGSVDAVP